MKFEDAITLAKHRSDCHPDNIETLVRVVRDLKNVPGDIVEVGSYRCGATIAMAVAAPNKGVYAFDLFGGLPYGQIGFENFADADFKEVQSTVVQFPNITLIRGKHEETIPEFCAVDDFNLSLIFMDSDHYSSHTVALGKFWPRLSSGGMVVFHDPSFAGVQQSVLEVLGIAIQKFEDSPNMGYIVKQ